MKKIKYLIFLASLCLFTGCYNYRELNQLGITSAVGISRTDDGKFELYVQVMNTQKDSSDTNSSGSSTKFVTYKTKGETVQEAFRNVILEAPRRLYVNHISLLIISEDVAREGLHDVMDLFARDTEFRKQFYVVISKNSETEEVLSTLTPLETLNAKNVKDSIDADHLYLGTTIPVTLEEMLGTYLNDYQDISLPSVEMVGNKKKGESTDNLEESMPAAKVIVGPTAVFKEDQLQGYLSKQEGIAYSFLMNEISNTILTHECENGNFASIEVVGSKSSMKAKKGTTKIYIDLKSKGNINEINCDVDLTKDEEIKKFQTEVGNELQKAISDLIDGVLDKYSSDIFGFEDLLYKTDPHYFKKLKEQYGDDLLDQLEIEVNVELQLLTKGNLLKVIQ